jgi:hypothetical protein
MIRPAKPQHIPQLVNIGVNASNEHFPQLIAQRQKIYSLVSECISGAQNFALISTDGKDVLGALLARTMDNMFAERKSSHVIYFANAMPGEGLDMLRQYKRWVQGRRAIKYAGISPAFDMDERVLTLFERAGFKRRGSNFIFFN